MPTTNAPVGNVIVPAPAGTAGRKTAPQNPPPIHCRKGETWSSGLGPPHLKVKTFVGTSENAVQIQVRTALIAMPLLKYPQLKSTFGWSPSILVALLRQQLFVYRDLWTWLNDPFQAPPPLVAAEQLSLKL